MDPRKFHFPVVMLDEAGKPEKLRGNAFPITANGDLLTCRHVVSTLEGIPLGVVDLAHNRVIPISGVRFPADKSVDLALLPSAIGPRPSYLPLLSPGALLVGTDVNAYGMYSLGMNGWENITDGYFAGHVVGFRKDGNIMSLSFPIIEGLSGSPVKTFHNGTKAVGIALGSESQRILASEVLEYRDESREVHETVHRLVEFGLAYRVETILRFCIEAGVAPTVTAESPSIPDLP
jgi:hypothetical protein